MRLGVRTERQMKRTDRTVTKKVETRKLGTKKALLGSRRMALIKALERPKPLTIARLATLLHLQPHSVRAAVSGLRKAGFAVETLKSPTGGAARYRLPRDTAGPNAKLPPSQEQPNVPRAETGSAP